MPQPITLEGLRKYQTVVQEQREKTRGTLKSMAENLRQLNQSYEKQTGDLMKAQTKVIEDTNETYDNLSLISRLPGKIAPIIGIFNSDFNRETQMLDLQRNELELNQIGTRMQQAQQRYKMATDTAIREAGIQQSILQYDREGFVDQTAMLELGWRVEDRINAETARLAENAGQDELRKWMADPSSAPAQLRDKRGLIELAYTQSMARELNVDMAQLSVAGQAINIARAEREEYLGNLTTNELQNGFNAQNLPEGIGQDHIVAEIRRREAREIDMQTAKLSLRSGLNAEATAARQSALARSTMNELTQLGMLAQENGGRVEFSGVTVTAEEIRQTLIAKTLEDQEQQTKINNHILATTGFEGKQVETAAFTQSIHSMLNPGVPFDPDNPMDGLPDDVQAILTTRMQQMEVMAEMGSPGGMVMVNQALNEELKTKREEMIENMPKEIQPAVREYITNSDMPQIRTPQVASKYLAYNASNPMMMSYDPTWSGVWGEFSQEMTRLQSENADLSVEDMSIESAVIASLVGGDGAKKDKDYLLAEMAINNLGLRDRAASVLFERLLGDSIQQLVSEGEAETSPWAGLYNAGTGRFHNAAYELPEEEGGQPVFSKDKWNDLLAQRSIVLHNNGTLPTDTTLMDLLYERMQTNVGQVRQYVGNDMAVAALNNVLFANRPENAVAQRIGDFAGQQERFTALEQARRDLQEVQQVQALQTEAEQAQSNATTKLARQGAQAIANRAEATLERMSPTARSLYDYMEKNRATTNR